MERSLERRRHERAAEEFITSVMTDVLTDVETTDRISIKQRQEKMRSVKSVESLYQVATRVARLKTLFVY